MRATYAPDIDMAYVYLTEIAPGSVTFTDALVVDHPIGRRLINLDFNNAGVLVGIEVDGAASTLPAEVLASAQFSGLPPQKQVARHGSRHRRGKAR